MKKPYFNQEDRNLCDTDTFTGALLRLHLETEKFKREVGFAAWHVYWKYRTIATTRYKNTYENKRI